ncbi:hypothetical protein ACM792_14575 [Metapseudomonas otitidis]|uniref:hypothetical protein n=1 Tax=Metapseudomonas otitidis TaxID=319939 RepID=UPI0039FD47C1
MSKTIHYIQNGQEHAAVLNGAVPSSPFALKLMLANHLGAPDPNLNSSGPEATDEELVDSRLRAIGITHFEILDR